MEKKLIGLYKNHKELQPQEQLTINSFLDGVKNGRWKEQVEHVRAEAEKGEEQGKKAKNKCSGVTLSGLFKNDKTVAKLQHHSGFIAIDIDSNDNEHIPFDTLAADRYCYALFKSVRGVGAVFVAKINGEKHEESYNGLESYLANNYEVITDASCRNVNRLRYVSYDAELYLNEKAVIFKEYPKKDKVQRNYESTILFAATDIEHIVQQIEQRGANIGERYDEWLKIGFALAKECGENGRSFFHAISRQSAKYKPHDCDKKYDACLRNVGNCRVGIGTLFYYAKNAGLETRAQRSIYIEQVARSRRNMVGQNGGLRDIEQAKAETIEYLKKMESIEGADVKEMVNKVMMLPENEFKKSYIAKGKTQESARNIIKAHYETKYNEVTGDYEINGKEATDRIYNSICVKINDIFEGADEKNPPTKNAVITLIESDFSQGYNPFNEFLNTHKALTPKNRINEVLDCFKIKCGVDVLPFFHTLIKKWLLGIISSMTGEHSVNLLVLCGKQGKGKTEFFRNLLPKELHKYYAESTLDAGKDDELLMCKKLLVLDDEYGGKSKQDEKRLKRYTSAQNFTMRQAYARKHETHHKYAVLCGATNENEVLNDYTGNRRIIPIPLESIDIERYKAIDKTELFIELYHIHTQSPILYRLTESEIEALKDNTFLHQRNSEEEELFMRFFGVPENKNVGEYLTSSDIKNHIELYTKAKLNAKALSAALYKLGFVKTQKRINGNTHSSQVYWVHKKPIDDSYKFENNDEMGEKAPF